VRGKGTCHFWVQALGAGAESYFSLATGLLMFQMEFKDIGAGEWTKESWPTYNAMDMQCETALWGMEVVVATLLYLSWLTCSIFRAIIFLKRNQKFRSL
jgi:hypothetical protein